MANDKVYQTLQRLFKDQNSELNLHRENSEKYRIRKLSLKRFLLGYPPRKRNDTSIGDALNWEWIIKCCATKNKSVIIVSKDTDYGIHIEDKSIINDFLNQEFDDRVSKHQTVSLTNKLSFAFKNISSPEITKQMETAEEAIINEEHLEALRKKTVGLNNFWEKFKDSLIDMFAEEDDKKIEN